MKKIYAFLTSITLIFVLASVALAESPLFHHPLEGENFKVSSPFGERPHLFKHKKKMHNGIDFAASKGTSVYAVEKGKVVTARNFNGYGETIMIVHENGVVSVYAHLKKDSTLVKRGHTVKRGEKIAEVGATGLTTAPHLHFEIRELNRNLRYIHVDPTNYIGN